MMASSYVLPASALHQHHHGDGAGSHSHSHSHTSSLTSLSPSRSRKDSRAHSHTRNHHHHHHHDSNHTQFRANANVPIPINVPPPSGSGGHWRMESTPGGKSLLSPTDASFDAAGVYEPPTAARSRSNSHSHSHAHSHDHHHDHSAPRSKFTRLLLRYTPRWPLLHAVVTNKDSRRIFYFMRFVPVPGYVVRIGRKLWLTVGTAA